MSDIVRRVYVISDLHLGGRAGIGSDRGFQMMTHPEVLAGFLRRLARESALPLELVINGDFVDFLAEEDEETGEWTPLIDEPARAVTVFRRMTADPSRHLLPIFAALAELLRAGHALTILLGNHDIELSYPAVRRELARLLGVRPDHGFQFIYDGEAYRIGDALIEHGNRYDAFNVVDYDGLRRRRTLQSRGQEELRDDKFAPPTGSRLVAAVMNPVKSRYAFVDLLKPETEAVFPLLLALEPSLKGKLVKLLATIAPAATHITSFRNADLPIRLSDASANGGGVVLAAGEQASALAPDPLLATLGVALGGTAPAQRFLARLEGTLTGDELHAAVSDASADGGGFLSGMWSLLRANKHKLIEDRLPALHQALQGLQHQLCFRLDKETTPYYQKAAKKLCERNGARYVLFGHSHLAREVDLGGGRTYLNTGTWANLLRLPDAIFVEWPTAQRALQRFVEDLSQNRLDIFFRPTYARIDLDAEDRVLEAHTIEVRDEDLALR